MTGCLFPCDKIKGLAFFGELCRTIGLDCIDFNGEMLKGIVVPPFVTGMIELTWEVIGILSREADQVTC